MPSHVIKLFLTQWNQQEIFGTRRFWLDARAKCNSIFSCHVDSATCAAVGIEKGTASAGNQVVLYPQPSLASMYNCQRSWLAEATFLLAGAASFASHNCRSSGSLVAHVDKQPISSRVLQMGLRLRVMTPDSCISFAYGRSRSQNSGQQLRMPDWMQMLRHLLMVWDCAAPISLLVYLDACRSAETFMLKIPRLENIYTTVFWPLLAVTCVLGWQTRPTSDAKQFPTGFSQFQLRYLFVWFLAITADWLQGPYVYELYASYGYSKADIARLFVVGFGSSMVTGTFIGSVADAWGRKFCSVLYCVLYAAACVTKHVNVYSVLMIGRLLGGAATSLLFSTFECWMVGEHRRCGFPDDLLRYMFGLMFFVRCLMPRGCSSRA